ncbi:hypothetical protein GCM10009769_13650 [Curtobacterium luteum]|uniref:Uncharacterized protein n=2 Tax=Curtobacterium luteum TaxID=33881 RepID=A0A8H9G921_9MICO|nr:hypothetical protein GCM10009769_13650 [Curtobacterium luteum]
MLLARNVEGAVVGDLTIEAPVMRSVASMAKSAGAEFGSERALSRAGGGCFGSDLVASAFASSARALDAMVRSLREDADTLSRFVQDALAVLEHTDAGLAVKLQ